MTSIKLDIGFGKQIGALLNDVTTEIKDVYEDNTNNNCN